jgi:hypothetical protein
MGVIAPRIQKVLDLISGRNRIVLLTTTFTAHQTSYLLDTSFSFPGCNEALMWNWVLNFICFDQECMEFYIHSSEKTMVNMTKDDEIKDNSE